METLYDLLGALPRDDAEGLRTAFRKAVKGAHPDLRPDDPDAGHRFREIMRAHDILGDGEQRAMYDHLLELARVEAAEDAQHAAEHDRAGKIHKLASWVMALAGASAVSIAGLALVALLWTSTEPAADTDPVAEGPAPTKVATLSEPPSPAPTVPAAPPAETADSALPPLGPPLDITPPAITESDHLHGFERAFADISHAKRPEKAGHAANAKKKAPATVEGAPKSTPPRRTAANDLSRQESMPFFPRP
jgi:curved DNA-binding protein CbpA